MEAFAYIYGSLSQNLFALLLFKYSTLALGLRLAPSVALRPGPLLFCSQAVDNDHTLALSNTLPQLFPLNLFVCFIVLSNC